MGKKVLTLLLGTMGPELVNGFLPILLDRLDELVKDSSTSVDDVIWQTIEDYFKEDGTDTSLESNT